TYHRSILSFPTRRSSDLFTNRNKRMEEQIALMRRLWTEPVVDFTGRWHRVDRAGLNPLPVQRPIPVWIGGSVDEALRRIARIAEDRKSTRLNSSHVASS